MSDVVAVGEYLIDFTSEYPNEQGAMMYSCNPGGAPVNVLVQLAKLGASASFIGKVGADGFGSFLADVLRQHGVDTRGMHFTDKAFTTLAFVTNEADGERSFDFNRNPGADQLLMSEEVDPEIIRASKIFHFGSVSLTHEPSRSATVQAVRYAKSFGKWVSYDPNLRANLWPGGEAEAVPVITSIMPEVDILKVSEEELRLFSGLEDIEAGAKLLAGRYDIALVLVTMGKEGCFYWTRNCKGHVAGFPVQAIDTTGAGDAFYGTALYGLLREGKELAALTDNELAAIVRYANAAGAWVTTRKGAIPALASKDELDQFIHEHS